MFPVKKLSYEEYPMLLREAGRPPKELYLRGEFPSGDGCVFLTVVGSRSHSDYGKSVCEALIAGLRGYPVVIVSGLAIGIDSVAHQAAIDAGLRTVAMPGSGLGEQAIYPPSNFELARRILRSGGCLISPFSDEVSGQHWAFPTRNIFMAGLSHATLVIEADIKSGTLITSKHATDLNRDVFAVPGSIWNPLSKGPHQLIRQGAVPITSPEDLLEALGFDPAAKHPIDYSSLAPDEARVVELLARPMRREELIERLGMGASQVSALLSLLELKGLIEERLGELRRV